MYKFDCKVYKLEDMAKYINDTNKSFEDKQWFMDNAIVDGKKQTLKMRSKFYFKYKNAEDIEWSNVPKNTSKNDILTDYFEAWKKSN